MSKATQADTQSESISPDSFSRETTLDVLSNQRRRFTMHYLKWQDGNSITVSELAERIASWENDKEIEELTHQERKRVRNALRQFHLPKMAEDGFIEYGSQRGTVTLSEMAVDTDFYIDSLTGGNIPWGMYYFSLSGLGAICLIGLWAEVFPFALLTPLTYSVFLMTAVMLSSIYHYYENYYCMRLGAREKPPEVAKK